MSATRYAQILYRVRTFVQTGSGASPDDLAFFVTAVDRYLTEGCSIEEALGLRLDHGENHPAFGMRVARRDDALRAAAAMLGETNATTAKELADRLKRYYLASWTRDRNSDSCPLRLRGRIEAHLWTALKARDLLIGEKQIQKTLAKPMELRSASNFPA